MVGPQVSGVGRLDEVGGQVRDGVGAGDSSMPGVVGTMVDP